MNWLASNWAWIALLGAFFALHLFAHGHGGHRHGRRTAQRAEAPRDAHDGQPPQDGSTPAERRRRGC